MRLESYPQEDGDEFIAALKAKAIGPMKIGTSKGMPVCEVDGRGPIRRVMEAHARGQEGVVIYEWDLHVTAQNRVYVGLDLSFEKPERGEALVFLDFQERTHLLAAAAAYRCGRMGLAIDAPDFGESVGVLFVECESEGVLGVALDFWAKNNG